MKEVKGDFVESSLACLSLAILANQIQKLMIVVLKEDLVASFVPRHLVMVVLHVLVDLVDFVVHLRNDQLIVLALE